MPHGFVVKNGSKIRSRLSESIPSPESSNEITSSVSCKAVITRGRSLTELVASMAFTTRLVPSRSSCL